MEAAAVAVTEAVVVKVAAAVAMGFSRTRYSTAAVALGALGALEVVEAVP